MLLPETGFFVLLKHFYVLESVLMTQSFSGDNGAVPAFAGVCVCVRGMLVSCFTLSILLFG